MNHLFFITVLKRGIILVRNSTKLNQQFILKQKFSASQTQRKLIFKIHDIDDIKLVNRLRLHLGHLSEHKFRYNIRFPIDSI